MKPAQFPHVHISQSLLVGLALCSVLPKMQRQEPIFGAYHLNARSSFQVLDTLSQIKKKTLEQSRLEYIRLQKNRQIKKHRLKGRRNPWPCCTGCRQPDYCLKVLLAGLGIRAPHNTAIKKSGSVGLCGPEGGAVLQEGADAFASMP